MAGSDAGYANPASADAAPARFDRPEVLLVEAGFGLRKALRWLEEEWRRNFATGA
jgi:hypothetical protein